MSQLKKWEIKFINFLKVNDKMSQLKNERLKAQIWKNKRMKIEF